jgi:hypothetical protein
MAGKGSVNTKTCPNNSDDSDKTSLKVRPTKITPCTGVLLVKLIVTQLV